MALKIPPLRYSCRFQFVLSVELLILGIKISFLGCLVSLSIKPGILASSHEKYILLEDEGCEGRKNSAEMGIRPKSSPEQVEKR